MKILLKIFLGNTLLQWVFYIAASIVCIPLIQQLGIDRGYYFSLVFLAGFMLYISTCGLLSRNSQWLLALPFSKKTLYGFSYLFNILVAIEFNLSLILISFVVFYDYFKKLFVLLQSSNWSLKASFPMVFKAFEGGSGDSSILGVFFLIVCTLHAAFVPKADILTRQKMIQAYFKTKAGRQFLVVLMGLGFGAVVLLKYYMSPFLGFAFLIYVLMLQSTYSTALGLSLSRKQVRRVVVMTLSLATLQVGVLYFSALRSMGPSSYSAFLGFVGPALSREDLSKRLLAANYSNDFETLSERYLALYYSGQRIRSSKDPFLSFSNLVRSTKTTDDLVLLFRLFDPVGLNLGDLEATFVQLDGMSPHVFPTSILHPLLLVPTEEKDLLQLLASQNPSANRYAIFKARYARSAALIPALEANLLRYADEQRISALKTLSILEGRYVGLDDFVAYKVGTPVNGATFFDTDCSQFHPKALSELNDTHIATMNVCLRKSALARGSQFLGSVESLDWNRLKTPRSSSVDSTISWILKLPFPIMKP